VDSGETGEQLILKRLFSAQRPTCSYYYVFILNVAWHSEITSQALHDTWRAHGNTIRLQTFDTWQAWLSQLLHPLNLREPTLKSPLTT
jgi:hypothetical protein